MGMKLGSALTNGHSILFLAGVLVYHWTYHSLLLMPALITSFFTQVTCLTPKIFHSVCSLWNSKKLKCWSQECVISAIQGLLCSGETTTGPTQLENWKSLWKFMASNENFSHLQHKQLQKGNHRSAQKGKNPHLKIAGTILRRAQSERQHCTNIV